MGESFFRGTYTYVVLLIVITSDLTAVAVEDQRLDFTETDFGHDRRCIHRQVLARLSDIPFSRSPITYHSQGTTADSHRRPKMEDRCRRSTSFPISTASRVVHGDYGERTTSLELSTC